METKLTCTNWTEKGVSNLAGFLGNTGELLTFTEFKNMCSIHIDFVIYSGLMLSIKKYICNTEIQVDDNNSSNMTAAFKVRYSIHKGTSLTKTF